MDNCNPTGEKTWPGLTIQLYAVQLHSQQPNLKLETRLPVVN